MTIGKMKQRITIERFTTSTNEWNEPIEEWAVHKTLWSDIQPLTGREYWAAKAVHSEVEGKAVIRYLEDLKPTDRIKYKERILEILTFMHPKEDQRRTEILYKEQKTAENEPTPAGEGEE